MLYIDHLGLIGYRIIYDKRWDNMLYVIFDWKWYIGQVILSFIIFHIQSNMVDGRIYYLISPKFILLFFL